MSAETTTQQETYHLHPIGHVRRTPQGIRLEIGKPFRPALKELDQFSHVVVVWWANQFDNEEGRSILQCKPPYAAGHLSGIFATRSPLRPNPIAVTICKLLGVDEETGTVQIANIDAVDGSPVVDLKAYFPVCDRVQEARLPGWLEGWPEWMPDEGIGLQPGEG